MKGKKFKGVLIVLILLVLILSVVLIITSLNKNKDNGGNNNSNGSSVIEFPPLTLCRNTGGNWSEVNVNEFPVNEEEGVYSPTTNSDINYKCFCPAGKTWDKDRGCK